MNMPFLHSAHPVLVVHLSLLLSMLLKYNIVPYEFGHAVVIPLIKNDAW